MDFKHTVNTFECKARASACDPPQDCDWPVCGCDPTADKVLEALDESGLTLLRRTTVERLCDLAETHMMQVPQRNPELRKMDERALEDARWAIEH